MQFLVVDFFVLVLVIGALMFFRRADRDNRSLEKVKRFTDRVIEDLSLVAEEKALSLRDIAVETDVHQQASKKAIERLREAEDGLAQKTQDMEELKARMETYNQALLELVSMTQKAEENISRLRDESAYIDKVGRRIRTAAGQLTQIEERLPRMLDDIQAQNQLALGRIQAEMTEDFAHRLEELSEELSEANAFSAQVVGTMRSEVLSLQEDLSARADSYRRAFDVIEQDYQTRLEGIAAKGERLESEVFQELLGTIQAHKLELTDLAARNDQDVTLVLDEIAKRISQKELDVQNSLEQCKSGALDRLSELEKGMDVVLEQRRQAFNEEVIGFKDEIASWQAELQASVREDRGELEKRLELEKQEALRAVDDLAAKAELVHEDMVRQLGDTDAQYKRDTEDFMDTVRNRVNTLETTIYQMEDELAGKLRNVHDQGVQLADNLLNKISQNVDTKTESMRTAIEQRVEAVNERVDTSHHQIEASFSELRGRVDSWIEDSRSYITSVDTQVRELSEESRRANEEHQTTVQRHIAETKERLDFYERGLSGRVQNLEEYITRAEQMVQDEFHRLEGLSRELGQKNEGMLRDGMASSGESLLALQKESLDQLRLAMAASNNELKAEIGQLDNWVASRLESVRQETTAILEQSDQKLEDAMAVQNRLDHALSDWKSAMGELEAGHQAALTDMASRLDASAREGEVQSNQYLEGIFNRVKESLDRERGDLALRFTDLQNHGKDLGKELSKEFQDRIQLFQNHAEGLHNKIQEELESAFIQQQERMRVVLTTVEDDISKLQAVSAESTAKMAEWDTSIRNTEETIRKEIDDVRDHARLLAVQQVETLRVDFDRRQEELSTLVQEIVQKMKSEIVHVKGDVEQDMDFVRKQMETLKAGFQDQYKSLEEHSRELEDQAITGLKTRIDDLKEESRLLARKYQEDFNLAMQGMQGSIAAQNEQHQGELKKVQTLARDIQLQFQKIQDEADLKTQVFRQNLEKEQSNAAVLLASAREAIGRQIQDMGASTAALVRDAASELQNQVDQFKVQGEGSYQAVQAQAQKWQSEYTERIKALVLEANSMRKDSMTGIQERIDAMRDEARKLSGNVLQDVSKLVNEHQLAIEQQLRTTSEEAKRIEDLQAASRLRFQEIQDILGKAEATAIKEFEGLKEKVRLLSDQAKSEMQVDLQRQRQELGREVSMGLELVAQDARKAQESMALELSQVQGNYRKDIESMANQFSQQRAGFLDELKADFERRKLEGEELLARSTERNVQGEKLAQDLENALASLQQDLIRKSAELETQIETYSRTMGMNIQKSTSEREQAAFVEIEKRLHDYESEISYRMTKLEKVNDDIDGLESGLRQSMERLSGKLREDVKVLGEEFKARRAEDMAAALKDMENVRLQMLSMEREIDELKKRAYDNINVKLKVFEDEFFVDLTDRSSKMQARLEEWREQVNTVLSTMESDAAKDRERLEQTYTETIKQRLADIQEKLYGGFQRLENQFGTFNQGLAERMDASEKTITDFKATIGAEVKQLYAGAQDFANQQFTRVRDDLDLRLRSYEREVEQKLAGADQEFKGKTGELAAIMESMRSDVSIWQTQVLQQFRSGEVQVQTDLAGLRAKTVQTIEDIRSDFARQKDDLAAAGSEERIEIKRDLEEVQTRLQRMGADLELKGREAIDAFVRQYQTFHTDMTRQNKDLADEVDERMSAYRGSVVDTRAEFDNLQKRLFGKIEDDAKVLDMNLKEIDKRIKAFMTHTKLFERADTLKDELEQKIGSLRQELESIETQKRDLINLDPLIEKVRRLTDEVNDKFTRLSSEKKRLDGLDEDFRRLTGLSQMVDTKLNQVSAASDTLTQIQLTLRQVEETQKGVEGKLERLEKKARLADATSETVDANFQALQEMEDRMKELRGVFGELPARVQDTQDKVTALMGGKKDVDSAIRGLASLDKILKDIESRTAELTKNREWLARTETRMSEISREAQEQVSLLGSLVKNEMSGSSNSNPSRTSGNMGTRDLVIKLAHQGWKPDEIAKTTKLSRGEVELILEMSNK